MDMINRVNQLLTLGRGDSSRRQLDFSAYGTPGVTGTDADGTDATNAGTSSVADSVYISPSRSVSNNVLQDLTAGIDGAYSVAGDTASTAGDTASDNADTESVSSDSSDEESAGQSETIFMDMHEDQSGIDEKEPPRGIFVTVEQLQQFRSTIMEEISDSMMTFMQEITDKLDAMQREINTLRTQRTYVPPYYGNPIKIYPPVETFPIRRRHDICANRFGTASSDPLSGAATGGPDELTPATPACSATPATAWSYSPSTAFGLHSGDDWRRYDYTPSIDISEDPYDDIRGP